MNLFGRALGGSQWDGVGLYIFVMPPSPSAASEPSFRAGATSRWWRIEGPLLVSLVLPARSPLTLLMGT